MKLAAAAYPLDCVANWAAYAAKQQDWVAQAAGQGADLLVFPEYGRMELAALEPGAAANLERSLHAAHAYTDRADDLMAELARAHGVYILAGSGPVFADGSRPANRPVNRPVNRAAFFTPDGPAGFQDKQIMTRFEREVWKITPGAPLRVFDTHLARIGVLICYDSEFPLLGRALIEAGVEIVLLPSCTDSLAGYWRVRIGAMARALEGQCVVVHSPTISPAPWCPAIDENIGAAGIYGPPDLGFPPTGILAKGALNTPGWVMADIDRATIAQVRREGAVFNHAHWPESHDRGFVCTKISNLP
jgi:predicted amidohydrolase